MRCDVMTRRVVLVAASSQPRSVGDDSVRIDSPGVPQADRTEPFLIYLVRKLFASGYDDFVLCVFNAPSRELCLRSFVATSLIGQPAVSHELLRLSRR